MLAIAHSKTLYDVHNACNDNDLLPSWPGGRERCPAWIYRGPVSGLRSLENCKTRSLPCL